MRNISLISCAGLILLTLLLKIYQHNRFVTLRHTHQELAEQYHTKHQKYLADMAHRDALRAPEKIHAFAKKNDMQIIREVKNVQSA